MRGTRAILAAALLTGLPVAAHAQGAHAPADAFLYIIWPARWHDPERRLLVPLWPSKHGHHPSG